MLDASIRQFGGGVAYDGLVLGLAAHRAAIARCAKCLGAGAAVHLSGFAANGLRNDIAQALYVAQWPGEYQVLHIAVFFEGLLAHVSNGFVKCCPVKVLVEFNRGVAKLCRHRFSLGFRHQLEQVALHRVPVIETELWPRTGDALCSDIPGAHHFGCGGQHTRFAGAARHDNGCCNAAGSQSDQRRRLGQGLAVEMPVGSRHAVAQAAVNAQSGNFRCTLQRRPLLFGPPTWNGRDHTVGASGHMPKDACDPFDRRQLCRSGMEYQPHGVIVAGFDIGHPAMVFDQRVVRAQPKNLGNSTKRYRVFGPVFRKGRA